MTIPVPLVEAISSEPHQCRKAWQLAHLAHDGLGPNDVIVDILNQLHSLHFPEPTLQPTQMCT